MTFFHFSKISTSLVILFGFVIFSTAQSQERTKEELEDILLEEKARFNEMKQKLENALLEEKALYNELLQKYELIESRTEEYQEVLKQRNLEDSSSKLAQSRMVQVLRSELEDSQAKIGELTNRVTIRIESHLLFQQGTSYITSSGFKVLDEIAPVLKQQVGQEHIQVEGHTDSTKISKKLKKTYPTNWELSTSRAVKVLRYLIDEHGFDPKRISAIGLGQYHPIADNRTLEGRRINRRVEFVVIPSQAR